MKVEIKEAAKIDKQLIRNMMELYNHDMSEYDDSDLNEHGLYDYSYLDNYWTEENRHAFIVWVEDNLAGFVLVNNHGVVISPKIDYSIAEFFILRKYRKRGIGKIAAFEVFKKFQGNWEVKQLPENKPAHLFWHKVVKEYTSGNFEELAKGNENWDGPILIFNNEGITK